MHAGGSITTHLNCKGGKKEGPDQSQEDTFKAKLVPPLWYVLLMLSVLSPKVKIVFLIRPNVFFFPHAGFLVQIFDKLAGSQFNV